MKKSGFLWLIFAICVHAQNDKDFDLGGLSEVNGEKIPTKCTHKANEGDGDAKVKRFFFDIQDKKCHEFEYTGHGGNDNNFESELDCLNDCFTGVEGEPGTQNQEEEDDVIIGGNDHFPSANADCKLPKDPGNGSKKIESFYFVPEWQSCFAFIFTGAGGNGNRFSSRIECEQNCLVADGSACKGPISPASPIKQGENCNSTECPDGFTCAEGFRIAECCDSAMLDAVRIAYSDKCPGGEPAAGKHNEFFVATFGATCDDLICGAEEKCQQISPNFAKCCGKATKKPTARGEVLLKAKPLSLGADRKA